MHEGHHGILGDRKQEKQGQHGHSHGHGPDKHHDHTHGKPGPGLWTKVVAGVVVAGLVIGFVVWRLF